MQIKQTIPVASNAHPHENKNQGDGDGLFSNQSRSKSELMSDLMAKSETYKMIGAAWCLAMRLLHSSDGKLIGSYAELGRLLGNVSGDSVKNWAKHLDGIGMTTTEIKGRQVVVRLTDEYMRIATAPDKVETTVHVLPPEYEAIMALQKIVDGATELGGNVKVSLEGCQLGKRNETQAA